MVNTGTLAWLGMNISPANATITVRLLAGSRAVTGSWWGMVAGRVICPKAVGDLAAAI